MDTDDVVTRVTSCSVAVTVTGQVDVPASDKIVATFCKVIYVYWPPPQPQEVNSYPWADLKIGRHFGLSLEPLKLVSAIQEEEYMTDQYNA